MTGSDKEDHLSVSKSFHQKAANKNGAIVANVLILKDVRKVIRVR